MQQYLPFTVLKRSMPATLIRFVPFAVLQQYLPFTVLKLAYTQTTEALDHQSKLQQYLPFTVLKHGLILFMRKILVATVLTVYGIETLIR